MRLLRAAAVAAGAVLAFAVVPRRLCTGSAGAYFDGEVRTQDALAQTVMKTVREERGPTFYRTGMARFDGQSAIAIYQMAVMGLGQIVQAHPEKRAEYLPVMQLAAERLVDPMTLRYAATAYGHHGVTHMGAHEGHAYLGYVNLALGMLRLVDSSTHLAPVHDRITADLAERLFRSP